MSTPETVATKTVFALVQRGRYSRWEKNGSFLEVSG